jgi:DNA invertase Pin-like site-specific DNA recombinase
MKQYVPYYRVSTKGQEKSGLGLEAQKAIVEHYAAVEGATIIESFIETESGADISNRPVLKEAINYCLTHDCILSVAKLDRLSRDIEHIFKLKKQLGHRFKSCDLPDTETLTLGVYAIFAQREKEIISIRTKLALEQKKKQGVILGKPENFTHAGRKAGAEVKKRKAKENPINTRAIALIKVCREQQGLSFAQIAEQLNQSGYTTPQGKAFLRQTVERLYRGVL